MLASSKTLASLNLRDLRHNCGLLPQFCATARSTAYSIQKSPTFTRAARQLNAMSPNLLFSVVLVAASLGHQYENFLWTSGYCRQDGDADAEVLTTASSLGHGTDEWCAARCNEDPSCVAWDNCGNNCWLHGAPRSTGVAGAGCECWVKGVSSTAPTSQPGSSSSSSSGYVMDDSTLRTAVDAWLSDATAAEATYGHISTWETGDVTDMAHLLDVAVRQPLRSSSTNPVFNDAIGAWDTSSVTTMAYMFEGQSSFNQNLGLWRIHKVTDMRWMFGDAWAFDQDLGWCLGNEVDMKDAFGETKCASTLCGVSHKDVIGICEPWARPCLIGTDEQCDINSPTLIIIIIIVLVLLAGVCVHWRRKKDETYIAAACRLLCCRSKTEPSSVNTRPDSPAESPPEEATVPKETEATAVAPEAEESPQETTLDELPPPPAKSCFRRAKPESEEAEPPPPLSPFSALRAERERELKMLANS